MKQLTTVVLIATLLTTTKALALDATSLATVRQALVHAPAAEMPAKAADLVKAVKVRDRSVATQNAVEAALEINPTLAPIVVSAVAKAVPDMVVIAADKAAVLQPKQAAAIAKAAALAAPTKVGHIVTAVCRAAPQDCRKIAVTVSQAVPGSDREVLEAVSAALPALKSSIQTAVAGSATTRVSVSAVLSTIDATMIPTAAVSSPGAGTMGPMAGTPRAPAIAPPFVPLSGTSTNVNPSDSDPVPRGGRNYASP